MSDLTGALFCSFPRERGKVGMGAIGPIKTERCARRIDAAPGCFRVADRSPPPNPPGPTQRVGRSRDPRGSAAQVDPAYPPHAGEGFKFC